ncbi:MAG: Hpt domain-containing protein, partial [Magnetococcales bacterium]|nr:Hpt domain-containing protein [Magnetococcales bacterium]
MSEEDDELLGMFVQEATEHLETIEPDLLTLEEQGDNTDPEIINRLFRGVHSIKGSAGFFGLSSITKLSHTMENLLGKVRDKSMSVTPAVTDSLLSGLDKLQTMIHDVTGSDSVDASEQIATIQAILEGAGMALPPPKELPKPAAPEEKPVEKPAEDTGPKGVVLTAAALPPTPKSAAPAGGHTFDLANHPAAVTDAITHGRRFYVVTNTLPAGKEDKVTQYNTVKALMESVGAIVATQPSFDSNKDLEALSDTTVYTLISTVLEEDLLLSLLQLDAASLEKLPTPAMPAQQAALPAAAPAAKRPPPRAATPASDDDDDAQPPEEAAYVPRLRKPKQAPLPKKSSST